MKHEEYVWYKSHGICVDCKSAEAVRGQTRCPDCKDKMTFIVRGISRYIDEPEVLVRKKLYRYYADNHYRNLRELKADYCPLIFGK